MTDNLKALITQCVEGNISFNAKIGGVYTIQQLIHDCTLKTINDMYQITKKLLNEAAGDSLFTSSNTAKTNRLKLAADVYEEVFKYKKAIQEAEEAAEKTRAEKAKKLILLQAIKDEKEIERLKAMNMDELTALEASLV